MRRLKKLSTDPPGGWYVKLDDGAIIKAGQFDKLIVKIKKHLTVNEIEIPDDLEDMVHDQICSRVPPNFCTGEDLPDNPPDYGRTLDATRELINEARTTEDSKVKVAVAIERIPICLSCQKNQNRMGCFKCSMPYKLSKLWCKGLPTGADDNLKACDHFHATGLSLIFSSDILLRKVYKEIEMPPDNCWIQAILKESDDG